jgi:cytochrome P450
VTWALYLLSQHPDVMTRLRTELDGVLDSRLPEYPDLVSLTYTRMVVNETFRLYPAFPMFFRSSVAADAVGPYMLPAGAQIIVSPYATHHDHRFWDDPETFDPQRFTPERFDARARNAYYPFGKGQRMCIGEPMALTITQLLIAAIVHAYQLEVTEAEVQPHYAMTYQPKNGLHVILRSRARAARH